MTTRWARFARGWVVAAFSTFVAALSHTVGGGAPPGLLTIVVSLAFSGVLCVGLSGRTLSLWRVSVSVFVSQLILHGLFSFGAAGGALNVGRGAGAHQHSPAPALNGFVDTAESGAHFAAPHLADHEAAMSLGHLIAGVITVAALRYGERAFCGLLENAAVVIRRLVSPVVAVFPDATHSMRTTAPVFTPRDLGVTLSSMTDRGPPQGARSA